MSYKKKKKVVKKDNFVRNEVGVGAVGSPSCWPGELPWVPPSSACCGHGAGVCRVGEERGETALVVLWDPWAGPARFVRALPREPPASVTPALHPAARSSGAWAAKLCAGGCWVEKCTKDESTSAARGQRLTQEPKLVTTIELGRSGQSRAGCWWPKAVATPGFPRPRGAEPGAQPPPRPRHAARPRAAAGLSNGIKPKVTSRRWEPSPSVQITVIELLNM